MEEEDLREGEGVTMLRRSDRYGGVKEAFKLYSSTDRRPVEVL